MSETRKNLQSIDGGEANEDEQVALNHEPEFRSSKSNLSKSKEKVSADGAEEKLLSKEEEAKIVARVDMADAKYHHSNGDTKIELDANKRQFSGLTKEELLKYADDPFWVNLRWFMFVLFWAMWVAMLAGAIAIIVMAPKCARPSPRAWYEKGPLVDMESMTLEDVEAELPLLKSSMVQGVFVEVPTYEILDEPSLMDKFKAFVGKAKEYGVKVIVELSPTFVPTSHRWFEQSAARVAEFADYFTWAPVKEHSETGPQPPNNWVSELNEPAWTYHETRKEFYFHQAAAGQPDLNFRNQKVVSHFATVLDTYMKAGAHGVRLSKYRSLILEPSLSDERPAGPQHPPGAAHAQYAHWAPSRADRPAIARLLANYSASVASATDEPTVFTLKEEAAEQKEWFLWQGADATSLRPPSSAPLALGNVTRAAGLLALWAGRAWPAVQLKAGGGDERELSLFAMVLPATPVLAPSQLTNTTDVPTSELLSKLSELRSDVSIEHGAHVVTALTTSGGQLLVCARWKPDHNGYVAVYNPNADGLRANLTSVAIIPPSVIVHFMSDSVKHYTNYTIAFEESADNVLVPPTSTIILSYVPKKAIEN